MRGSYFVFDCIDFLYHKCHKINEKCDGSFIGSPDRIKNKIATINLVNDDHRSGPFRSFSTRV